MITQSRARHFLAWNRTVFWSAPECGIRRIQSQDWMTHTYQKLVQGKWSMSWV